MKALALALLAASLSVGALVHAQTADNTVTHSLDNGRLWALMDTDQKMYWMRGYEDGLFAGAAMVGASADGYAAASARSLPQKLNHGEILSAVDHFYSDTPENGPVPISDALMVVTLKAMGAPTADVEKAAADFRRASTVR